MRLPNWNLLVAFEAVARHGNFSRAAEELNVLQPAVSRRVGQLERELEVSLLNRTRPTATLTADGQLLFQAVSGGIAQVRAAVQQICRASSEPSLTVGTTIGFANCFLMGRLSGFRSLYPDINVELISRDMNDGYNPQSCDVVTVFNKPERLPGITQSRIFQERMIAVCAPAYLEEHPILDGDLENHRLLFLTGGIHGDDWRRFFDSRDRPMPSLNKVQRYTSFMVYLQAAINGEGIAIGWRYLLDDLLDSGQLVQVADHELVTERGYFCCITERGFDRLESQRFVQWCARLISPISPKDQ